jgi:hypothetical protein
MRKSIAQLLNRRYKVIGYVETSELRKKVEASGTGSSSGGTTPMAAYAIVKKERTVARGL